MNGTSYRNGRNRTFGEGFWKFYPPLEEGRVYETTINGREIGNAVFVRIGGRQQSSVLFVEEGLITRYDFNPYDVKEERLLLNGASERPLSVVEAGMAARILKRKGLL